MAVAVAMNGDRMPFPHDSLVEVDGARGTVTILELGGGGVVPEDCLGFQELQQAVLAELAAIA